MANETFWHRLQSGIEVAVASSTADKLLGVRDGFLRYFHQGRERPVPVAVVAQPSREDPHGLELSDEETIRLARGKALELQRRLDGSYHFFVGAEGGLHSVELGDSVHHFVRSWAVVIGIGGETWGGSGSLEIPQRLLEGLDDAQLPVAVPGTRRRGGLISSLTGGLETRRKAVSLATFHALSTHFYGLLESGRSSI